MLSSKKILAIFIVCLIPFIFFSLKPDMIGFDSYAYVNHVCLNQPIASNLGADFVFNLLPCNFLVFKALLFIVFFVCTLTLALIGEIFDSKKGWLVFLFAMASPLWFASLVQFENDFLAYPLLFIGMYFTFKGSYDKSLSKFKIAGYGLIGLALICFAGLFWKGAIFYLLAVGLMWWYPLILFAIIAVWQWNEFIPAIATNWMVSENLPFIGVLFCAIMLLGYRKVPKDLLLPLFAITMLALVNSKFALLLIPLLIPGFVLSIIKEIKFDKVIRLLMIVLVVFIWLGAGIAVWFSTPNQDFWSALDYSQAKAVELGKPFKNEWSFGYWVKFKGIDTNAFEYGNGLDCNASICLTQFELPNCELINSFKQFLVLNCP